MFEWLRDLYSGEAVEYEYVHSAFVFSFFHGWVHLVYSWFDVYAYPKACRILIGLDPLPPSPPLILLLASRCVLCFTLVCIGIALSSRLQSTRCPARARSPPLNPFETTPMFRGTKYLDSVWDTLCSSQIVKSGISLAAVFLVLYNTLLQVFCFPLTGFSLCFAHPLMGFPLYFAHRRLLGVYFAHPSAVVGFSLPFTPRCCTAIDCFVCISGMALCSRLLSTRCSVRASSHRTTSSSTSGVASAPSSCRRPGGRAARLR